MKNKTNAMRILDKKKIKYMVHSYTDSNAVSGIEVADYLGLSYEKVFKTLVTISKSRKHYVFVLPVNKELDLKKAAKVVGEKNIEMIKSKELFSLTGYVHGGCSPIGMKKLFKTVIDKSVNNTSSFCISGGLIGYQIEISLSELNKALVFIVDDIIK